MFKSHDIVLKYINYAGDLDGIIIFIIIVIHVKVLYLGTPLLQFCEKYSLKQGSYSHSVSCILITAL